MLLWWLVVTLFLKSSNLSRCCPFLPSSGRRICYLLQRTKCLFFENLPHILHKYGTQRAFMTPSVKNSSPSTSSSYTTTITTACHWDHPIHKAALHNNLEAAKWLVTLNPSLLEASGFNGILPIHCAARRGHTDLLRCVLALNCRCRSLLDRYLSVDRGLAFKLEILLNLAG